MPRLDAAKKYVRKTKRRTARNAVTKKSLKVAVKKVRELISTKQLDSVKESLLRAAKNLDKSAKKHLIHPNKANRLKSRLHRQIKKLSTAPKQ